MPERAGGGLTHPATQEAANAPEPVRADSQPAESASAKPGPVEPTTSERIPAERATAEPATAERVPAERDNARVDESLPAGDDPKTRRDLARVAWALTCLAFLIAMVVLGLRGDMGYAGVTLAVALAAAINLF